MNYCVYCSSSSRVARQFFEAARELGAAIGAEGGTLVYGGCAVGLMGEIAIATRDSRGQVVGIIPQLMYDRGLAEGCAHDELVVVPGMRERKAAMEHRADAFMVLPGGFGTLEEFFEIVTLKQLGYHLKPVVLLNIGGFFDPLLELFEHIYRENFAKPIYRELYFMADSVAAAMEYIRNYKPPELAAKW